MRHFCGRYFAISKMCPLKNSVIPRVFNVYAAQRHIYPLFFKCKLKIIYQ